MEVSTLFEVSTKYGDEVYHLEPVVERLLCLTTRLSPFDPVATPDPVKGESVLGEVA